MSLIDFYLIEKKFKRNIIDDIINIYLKNHLTKIDVDFQTEPKNKKKHLVQTDLDFQLASEWGEAEIETPGMSLRPERWLTVLPSFTPATELPRRRD